MKKLEPLEIHRFSLLKYLQGIVFLTFILYFGKTLLIPLFFGLFIAIVMHPFCKWLEKYKLGKALAITSCLLVVTILISALLALLIWQINVFSNDVPKIVSSIETETRKISLILIKLGVTSNRQNTWIENLTGNIGSMLTSAFKTTLNTLVILFLTPIYTTLFMYHRKVFIQYLKSITPSKHLPQIDKIVQQTISTYSNYIKGIVLVYIIVGILNSIGLLVLGVRHAILFGMLCAIMTIIPYVGLIISAFLPISVIWLQTGNIWYPLGVIAIFSFIQYLEANVIFPKVVGTKLNVSTLAILVAIISGGIIWGVAGMVLFIPFVSIVKIISENIEEWKPINLLLSR